VWSSEKRKPIDANFDTSEPKEEGELIPQSATPFEAISYPIPWPDYGGVSLTCMNKFVRIPSRQERRHKRQNRRFTALKSAKPKNTSRRHLPKKLRPQDSTQPPSREQTASTHPSAHFVNQHRRTFEFENQSNSRAQHKANPNNNWPSLPIEFQSASQSIIHQAQV
jgi:hypothetical protein